MRLRGVEVGVVSFFASALSVDRTMCEREIKSPRHRETRLRTGAVGGRNGSVVAMLRDRTYPILNRMECSRDTVGSLLVLVALSWGGEGGIEASSWSGSRRRMTSKRAAGIGQCGDD